MLLVHRMGSGRVARIIPDGDIERRAGVQTARLTFGPDGALWIALEIGSLPVSPAAVIGPARSQSTA